MVDIVFNGSVTPSQTGGIIATTTNNDADAGSVGEYVEDVLNFDAPVAITSNSNTDILSISLTAGDWDVSAMVGFNFAGTTNVTNIISWVSSTSATLPLAYQTTRGFIASGGEVNSSGIASYPINTRRFSLSGTTTIYMSARVSFSVSTVTGFGSLSARRVR